MKRFFAKTTAVCLTLCLLLTVWCPSLIMAAETNENTVMVDTDFENGVPNTVFPNTGTLVTETVDDAHGLSMKVAAGQQAKMTNDAKGALMYVVEADVYALSNTAGGFNFVFESGWTDGPMFDRGQFKAKDNGTTKELGVSYQANVWYSTKLVIYPNTKKYDFYVGESGSAMTCLAKGYTITSSLTDFQRMILFSWTSDFYVDNLRFIAQNSSDVTVRITAPVSGGTVTSGETVSIQAQTGATAGIEKVDFYVNNQKTGTCYQAPYAVPYTPQGNSDLSIYAVVTDSAGLTAKSDAVTVHVTYRGAATSASWLSVIDANFDDGTVPAPISPVRETDGTIECVDSTADGHGKALRVAMPGSGMPYLVFQGGAPGSRYVLEADFRPGSEYGVSTNFVSKDGNTKVNGFNIESGYIGLPNGSKNVKLKEVTPGQWYSLKLEFDILNSVYSLSVNGELLAKDYAFPAAVSDFSYLRIYNWKKNGEYAIDNVRLSKLDTTKYNPAFIDTDFSDGVPTDVQLVKNAGTITLLSGENVIDEAHGAALKVAHGASGAQPYLQIARPNSCADTGYVMEADFYLGSDPSTEVNKSYGVSTNLVGNNATKAEGFNIESGGAGIGGYSGRYAMTPGKWYHLRFAFDLGTKTCSLYVDGNLLVDSQPIKNGEDAFYNLRIYNWKSNSFYVMDNLKFKTVAPVLQLAELTLTDEAGNPVSAVTTGNLTANALFYNDTDAAASAVLVLAVYDGDMLESVELSNEVTVAPRASAAASALVNVCGETSGKSVKVFVWKDKTNLVPFDGTMVHLTAN